MEAIAWSLLYAHVSDTMRQNLKVALQARWQTSLQARIAIHPHSPLPILDQLMTQAKAESAARQAPTAA